MTGSAWATAWQQPEQLVEVGDFGLPWELQLARGVLESAGVECFLAEEHAGSLQIQRSKTRLMVRAGEAAEAERILEAAGQTAQEDADA